MKLFFVIILVTISSTMMAQSQSLNTATATNCACSGQLWDVSVPYKPSVTFSSPGVSHRLMFTNYGFTIPSTASVTGVEVSFSYTSNVNDNSLRDSIVTLLHNSTVLGFAKESSTGFYMGSNTVTLGGNGDLWGTAWDPPSVNSSGFGFDFKLVSDAAGNQFTFVNGATITIYYSLNTGITQSQSRTLETKVDCENKIVNIKSDSNECAHVCIYSIAGTKCAEHTIDANSSKTIDVSYLKEGIYIYTLNTKTSERSGKFIIE